MWRFWKIVFLNFQVSISKFRFWKIYIKIRKFYTTGGPKVWLRMKQSLFTLIMCLYVLKKFNLIVLQTELF
jgi:hypothetical protein